MTQPTERPRHGFDVCGVDFDHDFTEVIGYRAGEPSHLLQCRFCGHKVTMNGTDVTYGKG